MTSIALLQLDPTVGDLRHNAQRLESLTALASEQGADVGVATELAVCGYPPRDLLLEHDFIQRSLETALSIQSTVPLLVGTPLPSDDPRSLPTNGVVRCGPEFTSVTGNHQARIVAEKQLLPTYDVFDEARYFAAKNRSGLARSRWPAARCSPGSAGRWSGAGSRAPRRAASRAGTPGGRR